MSPADRAPSTDGTAPASRTSRRAAFWLGGAGVLALLLAGCDGTGRLPSGTTLVSEPGRSPLPTTSLPPEEGRLIELPGVQYRVSGTRLSASLPLEPARQAGLEIADEEEVEEVPAASGEQLLVADLDRRPPSHLPRRPVPGTYVERVLLAGCVVAGNAVAVTPEGTWATPETLMVCLHVCTYPQRLPGTSMLSLILPDGSAAAPREDHSRVFEVTEGGGAAWFEVPADVGSATALVELGIGEKGLGTEEITVTFVRE